MAAGSVACLRASWEYAQSITPDLSLLANRKAAGKEEAQSLDRLHKLLQTSIVDKQIKTAVGPRSKKN